MTGEYWGGGWDCEWKQSRKGNFVCIRDETVVATVFRNGPKYAWQIIINIAGVGEIVENEAFDDAASAMRRAEEILDGANCRLKTMKRRA